MDIIVLYGYLCLYLQPRNIPFKYGNIPKTYSVCKDTKIILNRKTKNQ